MRRRATAAAAYRSGERLRDERTGDLFNHKRRRDVLHAEILLPSRFEGEPVALLRDDVRGDDVGQRPGVRPAHEWNAHPFRVRRLRDDEDAQPFRHSAAGA